MDRTNKLLLIVTITWLWFCGHAGSLFAQGTAAAGSPASDGQASLAQQQPQQAQPSPAQPAQPQTTQAGQEKKKELTEAVPVLEIRKLESEQPVYSIELRDVLLTDLFRVIAHDYNLNIIMDKDVSGTITASFTNISLDEALAAIADMANLKLEKKGSIIKVSLNLVTQTFVLKYIEARKLFEASKPPVTGQTGITEGTGTGLFGILSPKATLMVSDQQNALTVIDYPDKLAKVEEYLKSADHKLQTKVFKLKYLKADEVVGATQKQVTTTQTIAPTGTQVSTTTSTATASGTTAATGK